MTAVVARPVIELAARGPRGRVTGATSRAFYVEFDGFVLVGERGATDLPNGVGVPGGFPVAGAAATLSPEGLSAGTWSLSFEGASVWSPAASTNEGCSREGVGRRAALLLAAAPEEEVDPAVGRTLKERDPDGLAGAARALLGCGGGLTPWGDDLLAGVAAGLWAFGDPCGLEPSLRTRLVDALCPPDLRIRTTSLSATLLELAASGRVVRPAQAVLDLSLDEAEAGRAIGLLAEMGHSSGRGWAAGLGSCGAALSDKASWRESA